MLLILDIEFLPCNLFFLFVVVVLSRSLFNRRSRCNEAWQYLIQLLVWLCNNVFKLKHLFLFVSLSKI